MRKQAAIRQTDILEALHAHNKPMMVNADKALLKDHDKLKGL